MGAVHGPRGGRAPERRGQRALTGEDGVPDHPQPGHDLPRPDPGVVVEPDRAGHAADEAFVTGTFGGLTPVHTIDGRTIGTGEQGPMTQRLRELYEIAIEADVSTS